MEVNNSLPTGTILNGTSYSYRIERTLGQGSFGITYLASVKMAGPLGAFDANIKVAIKEFFMRDINGRSDATVTSGSKGGIYDDYKRKFTREAVNLSKLQHPNIIKVIESFEANNTVYYVMEYIGGGNLDDYIAKNSGLEEYEAIRIVKQIGSALAFMHNNKMLHLDLKPSNIMMKESGDIVLIDFGLSKQYDSKGEPESSTKVGAGTPGYAPIEQANYREGKDFPVTMDIYALGGTMFKMLTGVRPPEASEILNDGFPYGIFVQCGVNQALWDCIEKAMSPLKKNRYQSVQDLILEIDDNLFEKPETNSKENTYHEEDDEIYVCEVPVLYDDNYWGEYVVERGDAEYGTNELISKIIKGHIPMPDSVIVDITPNGDYDEFFYNIVLHKKGEGTVRVGYHGVYAEAIIYDIPDDVMDYFINNGYFSPVHWERESTTSAPGRVLVSCIFKYTDGTSYSRNCNLTSNHTILLNSIENLLKNTSLAKIVSDTKASLESNSNNEDTLNTFFDNIETNNNSESIDESKSELIKEESGCVISILGLLGIGLHAFYPLIWLLTLLSDYYKYPDIGLLLFIWIVGVLISVAAISKEKDNIVGVLVMWILLFVETAVVYYINYA